MNRLKTILSLFMLPLLLQAQVTLDECQQTAQENYPLIKKYDLINQTTDYSVSNISKRWLPQISVSAQATYQNKVTSWPDGIHGVFQQMGLDMRGVKKDQYKIGLDINQIVFDGGTIRNQKNITRLQGEVQIVQNNIDMYAIRGRVNELFFGILLTDDRIKLNEDMQVVLKSNEDKLISMLKNGTATESDVNSVKAERLNVMQQYTELLSFKQSLLHILSVFCGKEILSLRKPDVISRVMKNNRPELMLADTQLKLINAQEKMLISNLLPKLSVFAQGYYGYPGFNMFNDMMHHDFSWNGMVGARLTWNIGSLYTHKNDNFKIDLQRQQWENYRDVFLFNNNLQQIQQEESIEMYKKLMTDDDEIIHLRSSVREASESKLKHGMIDTNNLLMEINKENNAKVSKSIHEIEMLKQIYDLKYTTNN
ncbi:MAG: TolC family protein [Phocaeicola sp.]|uniref:TolC family protein n=1 Tax=Phocaeicola sp. TaxID=2773926 RepID=UPI003FA108EE